MARNCKVYGLPPSTKRLRASLLLDLRKENTYMFNLSDRDVKNRKKKHSKKGRK